MKLHRGSEGHGKAEQGGDGVVPNSALSEDLFVSLDHYFSNG